MTHSLEARTPFLDHELVETVFSIPTNLRFDLHSYKSILRESMSGLLPKKILDNKNKRGFRLPISFWMRSQLRPLVEKYLGKKNIAKSGYLNPSFYDDYVYPFLQGDNNNIEVVWGFFIFHFWEKETY